MGVVNSDGKENSRFWNRVFIAGLMAGIILRIYLASTAQTPGHGDTAFYYTVAKNLADGRGFVIDYVVYFLDGPRPITHYSSDFWNPLASILLSLPMFAFGKSVFNATLASIVFGVVPAVIGYLAGKHFSNKTYFAAFSGILTFFAPILIRTSVSTDSIIFFGAFGALALYLTIKSNQKPYYLFMAAACTGLAQFTRQDGVLLLVAVEGSVLFMGLPWKKKVFLCTGVLAVHMLVLSPLMFQNYAAIHAPFPQGPSRTAFLTRYEDFHAFGNVLNWDTYRGKIGLRGILALKLNIARDNLNALQDFLDPVVAILTIIGLLNIYFLKRDAAKIYFLGPVLLFAITAYLFYSVVASFSGPGSLPKSLAVLAPFVCIVIVDLLSRFIQSKALLRASILLLALYTGYRGFQQAYAFNRYYNEAYKQYRILQEIVTKDAVQRNIQTGNIIIMTRNPWDVYAATGFRAVMIPNNDLKIIYYIANIYDANYLLLPAPRPALQQIYTGAQVDPRFDLVATIPNSNYPDPDFRIFRIQLYSLAY